MAETPLCKRRDFQPKINNSTENSNNNSEKDRLSSLPDTLLIEILSLLPLKSAAATSVLSHRWRPLWTLLPHLLFDVDDPPWVPDNGVTGKQRFIRFKDIVPHILRQITSPVIQTFNLLIPDPGNRPELCTETLNSLITLISTRNVAAIKVILDPCSNLIRNIFVPSCIFEIQSLVELHLDGFLSCNLPIIKKGFVSLPNLKKLELGYIFWDDLQKLWALINSCPILEFLSLEFDFSNAGVVNISLPMLKSLIINGILTPHSRGAEFVIDTPVLEQLSLHGYLGYYRFVKYPSKLMKAELCILDNINGLPDFSRQLLPVFQRISGVEYLILDDYMEFFKAFKYLDVDFGSIFGNVTHLRLNNNVMGGGFDVQNPIPLYLFKKLKVLEIEMTIQIADNMKLLDYILRREANVLKELSVLSIYSILDNGLDEDVEDEDCKRDVLFWEYRVYQTLLAVPKRSLPNQFEFVGILIRVSSDRSRKGFSVSFRD